MLPARLKVPGSLPGGLLGATPVVFSEQSKKKMAGVNPALADLMTEVERRALAAGIKLEVSEGLRTPDRQAGLVAAGKSQTMKSKHITGNALDVHVVNPDGSPNWDFEAYRPVADIAKQVAAEKGIPDFVWGGDWKTLKDGVHFQVGGPSGAGAQGGGNVVASSSGGGLLNSGSSASASAPPPVEEKKRGLLGLFSDPDKRAQLAIALEGMTLNPNTALMGMLGEGVKDRRGEKKATESTNKTVAWLRSIGQNQLADALETGVVDPGAVVGQALQAMQPKPPPEPIKVGDVLLDPVTYLPIFDGRQADGGDAFTLGTGQVRYDAAGNKIAEGPAATASPGYRQLTPQEVKMRPGLDPNKAWQISPDGKVDQIGSGGTTVNNIIDGGGAFEEAFAKGDAATIETVYNSGLAAQRNLGRIDQLGALLDANPTGLGAALTVLAGEWGINTAGLGELQAAQAMINALVPEQRQPGSGPMSDADLALFKQSLPQLITQPGGNKIIVETMRGIAKYDAEGAAIVQQLRNGELTRAQAFDALQNRVNPLASMSATAATPAAPASGGPVVKKYDPATGGYK